MGMTLSQRTKRREKKHGKTGACLMDMTSRPTFSHTAKKRNNKQKKYSDMFYGHDLPAYNSEHRKCLLNNKPNEYNLVPLGFRV